MDEISNKPEIEDLSKECSYAGVTDSVKRCESPVFKFVNHTKGIRGNNLNSSDYDIPSYQMNQSTKSRISHKYGSEGNESVLPLSPIFSPLPIASAVQFQPPSIHSLGTVAKTLHKSCKKNEKGGTYLNNATTKSYGLFESLGMNDKDISWVSSMATPPPKQVPSSQFNTIEKATFLPEEKFQNIQPRALFSPNLDDDFGCHPISFCSESEEEEAYRSNIRLSDVCATLRQLEVKSFDLPSDHSAENATLQEQNVISPVMNSKKKKFESVKKKKKKILVASPDNEHKYLFSMGECNVDKTDKSKIKNENNIIEDDSFQSMSFSGIDELCKTLVSEESNSSAVSKSGDFEKTIVRPSSSINSTITIPKIFYNSKNSADIFEVSSINNLLSSVKTLEGENSSIKVSSKIDKSLAEKGIVRFDILHENFTKINGTKRLHSEVIEEKNESEIRKYRKVDDENTDWEKMKQYLSESQLNVSDGEIFRTVENLEKTLASQETNGKLSDLLETECLFSEKSSVSFPSKEDEEKRGENEKLKQGNDSWTTDNDYARRSTCLTAFTNVLGSRIAVSREALRKGREILKDCVEECSELQAEKLVEMSHSASHKDSVNISDIKKLNSISTECEMKKCSSENLVEQELTEYKNNLEDRVNEALMGGFSTSSGKKIEISAEALKRAKILMTECDESSTEESEKMGVSFSTCFGQKNTFLGKALDRAKAVNACYESDPMESRELASSKMKGFMRSFEKTIQVSRKALEKAQALKGECDESSTFKVMSTGGFSTCSGKKIEISTEALEKAKTVWAASDLNTKDNYQALKGFSTCSGKAIAVSAEALEKAKALMSDCEHKLNDITNQAFDNVERVFNTTPDFNFSNASDDKVEMTEKVLQKTKPSCCENEENEGGKEEHKEIDGTKTKKEDSAEDNMKILGVGEAEDWEEIVPAWLHVYTTSPSIASDRTELTPLVAPENLCPGSSRTARAYMVKSPVLGASDRFQGKRKRRRLRFEEEKATEQKNRTGFVVPYKDLNRKAGAKRMCEPAMDFSVPFKKVKFLEKKAMEVGCDVKKGRAERREEQEKVIKNKNKVKPIKGLHFLRKSSKKQTSWMEAVNGSPPEIHSEEALKSFGVREDVLCVRINNAISFTFNGDFFGANFEQNIEGISVADGCVLILDDENKVGVSECKRAFLASSGVQPSLVPEGWVENHYKWIVWKLAHYEKSFPRHFAGRCLTPENVMLQLKYRYDREIDGSERSALKKILERDDTSAKRLVLCVCGIEKIEAGENLRYELQLTDGWYSISARPDPAMTRILDEGKVCVGTKLITQGAVLVSSDQGVSPLEVTGDVHLKISTNSTRRVKWDTKLGFQKNPRNFPISLNSILAEGGPISRIDVIIVRVYPVLYMEKTSDGYHVTRNRRSEEKAEAQYRKLQEHKMEVICNEIQMEMKNLINSERKSKSLSLNNFEQLENINDLMKNSLDSSVVQELMAIDPKKTLENFQLNQSDRFRRELSEKIEKKLEKENLRKRNVSEFFKAKVVDMRKPDYNNPAVLSVWHPNEELLDLLSEGKVISLMNVTIRNSSRVCKPLQINTTRQTQYVPISRSVKYPSRKLTPLQDASSKVSPLFEEVDIVGMVVLVRDISYGSRLSQVIYLTDAERNFVGIVFWGSCKNYGWENVLKARCIVTCSNLQWKKNVSPHLVPSLYANENSVFTENPKQSYLKEEMEKLKRILPQDLTEFLTKCEEDLVTKLEESKWRSNSSGNSSKMESVTKCAPKGSSSGFECRPTASSTPIKPFSAATTANDGAEPSPIQKRIQKLQSYGEPPPLVPLLVSNKLRRRNNRKKSSLASTSL